MGYIGLICLLREMQDSDFDVNSLSLELAKIRAEEAAVAAKLEVAVKKYADQKAQAVAAVGTDNLEHLKDMLSVGIDNFEPSKNQPIEASEIKGSIPGSGEKE
jgi:hypothetical protein